MGSFVSTQTEEGWKSDARHAMEAGRFCVICGGPFDIEGNVYTNDPKDPRFQWLYDLRLLGDVRDANNHMIASAGLIATNQSEIPDIFLSEPALFNETASGYFRVAGQTQGEIWFEALSYGTGYGTLFPLHAACITTSCRAIEHHQSRRRNGKRNHALAILSRLLNTRFAKRNSHADDSCEVNDLFSLCSYSPVYGPRSVLAMTRLEWWGGEYDRFYTDPSDESGTALFVQDVLRASPLDTLDCSYPLRVTRQPERLERLPTELLDEICLYLPVQSVIALHRTSKALTIRIPLDTAFWRNSLRDGSLHPHIWDLDTKWIEHQLPQSDVLSLDPAASWDWKSVAKLLAKKRFPVSGRDSRLVDVPNAFWNRCRIWATIEEALQEQDAAKSSMSQ
ncbi:hypothetical protein BDW02DRAFT_599477 [Decorospora gaudefroyi]|uniref:F-box domain-containing protein n=1 Tax=Decorospora gaudefroyi TaxID=184978 RepID=A0A6A5KHV7_9PLEO|nr:hypothetical protein BDW02DRAFT_599477 [Decorospora gaudefroyi]